MSKELIERLRNTNYYRLDPYEAADRIEQLEAENTELKCLDFRQMREMLRAMQAGELTVSRGIEILEMWSAGNWSDNMLPPVRHDLIEEDSMPVEIIDRLKEQLAASQLREQQLLEACACADWNSLDLPEFTRVKLAAALRLPSDTAALESMIQKAGEAMREKAKIAVQNESLVDDTGHPSDEAYNEAVIHCIEAIRALPGVKLEDLK